jgi:hypothetical protein
VSKHTPGPWRIGKQGGSVVADTPVPEMGGSDSLDYYGGHLIAESITPSNAKLIAAAPELLDVVRRCELWLGTLPEGRVMQLVCQQVITKATE